MDLASSYDSSAQGRTTLVTLVCDSPLCSPPATNGFLIVPSDESGAPAGTLSPTTPGWSQSMGACGGLTHTQPTNATSWEFIWQPAGVSGTVTFRAAVAAGYDNSFLAVGCLMDTAATASDDTSTSMAGMDMRRSRALLQQGAAVPTCPSSAASHSTQRRSPGAAMSMNSAFFVRPTGWGLLFSSAFIATPGELAAAVVLSALFGAVTVVLAALVAPLERRAACDSVTARQALAGALGTALRTGCHYLCMLLVMSFSVWIVIAVVGGHALGVLTLALLRRAALFPAGDTASSAAPCCDAAQRDDIMLQ